MKSYQLIYQLIALVEHFETEHGDREGNLHDFAGFLLNNLEQVNNNPAGKEIRFGKSEPEAQNIAFQIDNNISRLLVFMSRYARLYLKKALDGTPLQTPEDFTALAILLTHEHLLKSELIARNIQEKTSGTEVIRRLIAAGLINQWADQHDKRGRRISITTKGKTLLYEVFHHTTNAGKVITGNLTLPEKLTLQYLLQKLEDFHHQVYEHKTIANKDDLHALSLTI